MFRPFLLAGCLLIASRMAVAQPVEVPSAPPGPTITDQLLAVEEQADDQCRSSYSNQTDAICVKRDYLVTQLKALHMCYGRPGEFGYQENWHPCDQRDVATVPAAPVNDPPATLVVAKFPVYDVTANCAPRRSMGEAYYNGCVSSEQEHYDFLKATWDEYQPGIVQQCDNINQRQMRAMAYTMLSDCVVEREDIYDQNIKLHTPQKFQR